MGSELILKGGQKSWTPTQRLQLGWIQLCRVMQQTWASKSCKSATDCTKRRRKTHDVSKAAHQRSICPYQPHKDLQPWRHLNKTGSFIDVCHFKPTKNTEPKHCEEMTASLFIVFSSAREGFLSSSTGVLNTWRKLKTAAHRTVTLRWAEISCSLFPIYLQEMKDWREMKGCDGGEPDAASRLWKTEWQCDKSA